MWLLWQNVDTEHEQARALRFDRCSDVVAINLEFANLQIQN